MTGHRWQPGHRGVHENRKELGEENVLSIIKDKRKETVYVENVKYLILRVDKTCCIYDK